MYTGYRRNCTSTCCERWRNCSGNVMKVTLSCDHRVVDGATGSAFLQTLKSLLEEPLRMLV